jgi:dUTP pyrophosphatase
MNNKSKSTKTFVEESLESMRKKNSTFHPSPIFVEFEEFENWKTSKTPQENDVLLYKGIKLLFKNSQYIMCTRGFEFVTKNQALKDFDEEYIDGSDLKLPKRGTSKSAGYDIFAPYEITLQPNEEIKVPTGLKAYMQDGEVLMAFPRSGLGFKYYCRLANTVGVIDGDYYNNTDNEGHMFVKLRNEGTKPMTINKGEGMCQMIFMPFLLVDGDSFNEGETRNGGFGSTTGGSK